MRWPWLGVPPSPRGGEGAAPNLMSHVTGVFFTPAVEVVITFHGQPKSKLPLVQLLVYSSIDKTAFFTFAL